MDRRTDTNVEQSYVSDNNKANSSSSDLWILGPMAALEHSYFHEYIESGSNLGKREFNAPAFAEMKQMACQEDLSYHDSSMNLSGQGCMSEAAAKAKGGERGNMKSAANACNHCRRRKTKCSAQRPVCSSCHARGLDCSWDVVDGLTRHEDLKRKVQEAEMHLHHLCVFVGALKLGNNHTSTLLLAKLRLGASIEELVQSLPPNLAKSAGLELCYKQWTASRNDASVHASPS